MTVNIFIKFITFLIVLISCFPLIFYLNPFVLITPVISFIISLKFEIDKRWLLNLIGIFVIILTFFIFPRYEAELQFSLPLSSTPAINFDTKAEFSIEILLIFPG